MGRFKSTRDRRRLAPCSVSTIVEARFRVNFASASGDDADVERSLDLVSCERYNIRRMEAAL